MKQMNKLDYKIKDLRDKIRRLTEIRDNKEYLPNGFTIGMSLTSDNIFDSSELYQGEIQYYEFNHCFNHKNLTQVITLLLENLNTQLSICQEELEIEINLNIDIKISLSEIPL